MENYPIFVLQNELEKIRKRLDSDVIVDLRFKEEIDEDKDKVGQLKRSIDVLKYVGGDFLLIATNVLQLPEGRDFNHKINLKR